MTTNLVLYVAVLCAVVSLAACVVNVSCSRNVSRQVMKLRSTTSLQGELIEIRDYMSKLDAWSKRINARLVMEARRASNEQPDTSSGSSSGNLKDDLRRRAGLIAGQPAPHNREH